jgi:hypothetical protein
MLKAFINNHLLNSEELVFRKSETPVQTLKKLTHEVKNEAGLYFLFIPVIIEDSNPNLIFEFNSKKYTMCYFGKAGGLTRDGKKILQGLNGRINNVTSDSSRGLKDIKRAIYWNQFLTENQLDSLILKYIYVENPLQIEREIYKILKTNNIQYPELNKKLGKKKVKVK